MFWEECERNSYLEKLHAVLLQQQFEPESAPLVRQTWPTPSHRFKRMHGMLFDRSSLLQRKIPVL